MAFSKAIALLSLLALLFDGIGATVNDDEKGDGATKVSASDTANADEAKGTAESPAHKGKHHTLAQEEEETERTAFISALKLFVNDTVKRNVSDLINEFTKLDSQDPPKRSSQFDENMECNRYSGVICAEETQVHLNNGRYIHANWINFRGAKRFICTQGPLPTTIADFWTMIVQEQITSIVMLCNTVAKGENKCAEYWPTAKKEVLSLNDQQITVKFINERHVESKLYMTNLVVEAPQMHQKYMLVQKLHWRDWPDFGVPKDDLAMFHLLQHMHRVQPLVVHCSAGVGRTGTIVAISLANETLTRGLPLDIPTLVGEIRQQRAQSVETIAQYLYIYYVFLHFAQNNTSQIKLDEKTAHALDDFLKKLEANMPRG